MIKGTIWCRTIPEEGNQLLILKQNRNFQKHNRKGEDTSKKVRRTHLCALRVSLLNHITVEQNWSSIFHKFWHTASAWTLNHCCNCYTNQIGFYSSTDPTKNHEYSFGTTVASCIRKPSNFQGRLVLMPSHQQVPNANMFLSDQQTCITKISSFATTSSPVMLYGSYYKLSGYYKETAIVNMPKEAWYPTSSPSFILLHHQILQTSIIHSPASSNIAKKTYE